MRSSAAALLVLLTAALYAAFAPAGAGKLVGTQTWTNEKVLLVTAHPDDECMFFAPTLLALGPVAAEVHNLCLSVGNQDGLGSVRKEELARSLDVLGIPAARRKVLDHPYDAPLHDRPPTVLMHTRAGTSRITSPSTGIPHSSPPSSNPTSPSTPSPPCAFHTHPAHLPGSHPSQILTFDAHGVSGHPNHRALFHGASLLARSGVRLYTLTSVPLAAKYTGPLAPLARRVLLPLGRLRRRSAPALAALSGGRGYRAAHRAMRAHASQLVWFRHAYVLASRYMWVNDWVAVT
jgi:N-acetylglucosaminylphosphatidylinositol deacetylase